MTTSFKPRGPRGIAVARVGALGDTIVTFPLLAALRRRFPHTRIVAIGRGDALALARRAGWCDAALSSESIGWWTVGAPDVPVDARMNDALRGVELVFDFDTGGAGESRAAELGVREWRSFAALPPAGFAAPAARWYLDAAGERDAPPFVRWHLARAAPSSRSPFVVAPGAGSPRKRAPIEWFAGAARTARSGGIRVAVVVGEADDAAAADARAAGFAGDVWWSSLPLLELARRLARACGFVANDSGVAHLAALVGLPGIVRFTSSDPVVWAPPSPRVRAVASTDGVPPGEEALLEIMRLALEVPRRSSKP